MANTDFKSIDAYIATKPKDVQVVLERMRGIIRKAVPGAVEAISYQIPTYKLHGRNMIHFAGWKEHYSLYPATAGVVATFKQDLVPYELSKGTIRFPFSESVPTRLIARIAKLRAREVAELLEKKAAGVKKAAAAKKKSPARKNAPASRR
ncbi:MAG TPA: DUF1801 domain-containing protein [Polyangiaceae bacterium]|nr:DUF1801 domain-containing protein [Polyangiaceae bacterium]